MTISGKIAIISVHRATAKPLRSVPITICLATLICFFSPAFAQDCSPLKPTKPVDTEVANKTKADANILLRSLGSGSIENDYKSIEKDVLKDYPNADHVHVWDSFVYMLCTMIASSDGIDRAGEDGPVFHAAGEMEGEVIQCRRKTEQCKYR